MALLFHDGFDHYATASHAAKWTVDSGTITTASKRTGVNGLHNPSGAAVTLTNASGATFIAGVAVRATSGFFANMIWLDCLSAGATQVLLINNVDGTLTVKQSGTGGTTLAGPSTWVAVSNTWYYVEMKVVISDTVGSVEVRIDGTPVLNVSGVDTQVSATSIWNGILISAIADFDDLYVCDGSGSVNNDFLGDCVSEALIAQSDATAAGFNAGLTPSTGTDHGALVDDATPNGDTDYNSSASAGAKDTYNFPSMTSSGAIRGVSVLAYARKIDQASKTVRPVVRHAGTDYPGTTVNIPVGYTYIRQVYETNPGTAAAWTAANVNAVEAGLEIVS